MNQKPFIGIVAKYATRELEIPLPSIPSTKLSDFYKPSRESGFLIRQADAASITLCYANPEGNKTRIKLDIAKACRDNEKVVLYTTRVNKKYFLFAYTDAKRQSLYALPFD